MFSLYASQKGTIYIRIILQIAIIVNDSLRTYMIYVISCLCESTKKRSSSIEHVRFIGPDEFGGKF